MAGLENFMDEVRNTEFDITFDNSFLSEGKMVIALASLMFVLGTGISVGGCIMRMRDGIRVQRETKESEKVQLETKKIQPLTYKGLFICR